jgi:hypothetical protein
VARAPLPHLAVALLLGLLAAFVVTGCGADRSNLIPQSRASELTQQLADIKSAIDAGECDGLSAKVDTFKTDANNLGKQVDTRLRSRINEGARSLKKHAVSDCTAAAKANAEPTTDTPESTAVPETTTTTETQTTATTTTPTTPTTPTVTTPTTPTTPTDTTTDGTGDGTGDGSGDGATPAPGTGGSTPGDGTVTP